MSRHSQQQAVPAARRPGPGAGSARLARRPVRGRDGERARGGVGPRGTAAPPAAVARVLAQVSARLPAPRLTALGSGLLAALAMVGVGGLDMLLLGGSTAVYGSCFLVVCAASALWVRPLDLLTVPVAAPLAYTAGLFFLSGGTGFGGTVMGLVTALSVNAGWVYGGTLLAALIALVRRVLFVARRRRAARR